MVTNMGKIMTDRLIKMSNSFVLPNQCSVILAVSYNTIISAAPYRFKYLQCKTMYMKQFATFLLLIATGSGSIAQDSLKTADTSQKFNQQLAEVTITAKRPLMIQSVDKTIVDVKAMVSGAALNTIELLERIPGITVSANGDISLNGRAGVLVLIEGRSTYMSSQDLASYLKSIPAANLDKIELIDNPSSRYDASGNAIINIKMRKNRNPGLTGSVNSGMSQGKFFRSNNSV